MRTSVKVAAALAFVVLAVYAPAGAPTGVAAAGAQLQSIGPLGFGPNGVTYAADSVAKRSGVTEPFVRDKIVRGVRRACQGRPVDEDQLAILAQRVEETIRSRGCAEIPSHEVGLAILGPLRELNEVAYLRFASVYRGFESLADFEKEIEALREERASLPLAAGRQRKKPAP